MGFAGEACCDGALHVVGPHSPCMAQVHCAERRLACTHSGQQGLAAAVSVGDETVNLQELIDAVPDEPVLLHMGDPAWAHRRCERREAIIRALLEVCDNDVNRWTGPGHAFIERIRKEFCE